MPNVLLGVCGGIAAYKSAEIVRELQRQGADVRVIMTRSAQEFIQPLTFASLSGHRVFTNLWESPAASNTIEHIAQAQWADVLLIAPATAKTIAKLAHGFADDFLSATYLATKAPVLFALAMNVNMLHHPATRSNLLVLEERGHTMIESESGYLACGMTGDGRLADTETIVRAVLDRVRPAQPFQRKDGLRFGRCRRAPRSARDPRLCGDSSHHAGWLRVAQRTNGRRDARCRAFPFARSHGCDEGSGGR
jgi:phosphopantothenoylcysteine decarboxylase/phosphopantothenate--cysteine ligase